MTAFLCVVGYDRLPESADTIDDPRVLDATSFPARHAIREAVEGRMLRYRSGWRDGR